MKNPVTSFENTYDVYVATFKWSEQGKMSIDSKWEFDGVLQEKELDDIWDSNGIYEDYFIYREGYVWLVAKYNTKEYINLQKRYDEYKYKKWGGIRKSLIHHGHKYRHFVRFRRPRTKRTLMNTLCKNELRELKEEYPNTKLSLKNGRLNHVPTSWDDIPRDYSKCWKDCNKNTQKYE